MCEALCALLAILAKNVECGTPLYSSMQVPSTQVVSGNRTWNRLIDSASGNDTRYSMVSVCPSVEVRNAEIGARGPPVHSSTWRLVWTESVGVISAGCVDVVGTVGSSTASIYLWLHNTHSHYGSPVWASLKHVSS